MDCPMDGTQLVMTERAGVEIDYCPKCRGVWLDRGELDKIIERSEGQSEPPRGGYQEQTGYHSGDRAYHKKKKKGGLLGEIFDF